MSTPICRGIAEVGTEDIVKVSLIDCHAGCCFGSASMRNSAHEKKNQQHVQGGDSFLIIQISTLP